MASDTPGYISPAQMFPESFLSLAEDGFTFLQMHVWSEVQTENDFAASVAVAKAILQGAEQKADIMSRISDISEVFRSRHIFRPSLTRNAEKLQTNVEHPLVEYVSIRGVIEPFRCMGIDPVGSFLDIFTGL